MASSTKKDGNTATITLSDIQGAQAEASLQLAEENESLPSVSGTYAQAVDTPHKSIRLTSDTRMKFAQITLDYLVQQGHGAYFSHVKAGETYLLLNLNGSRGLAPLSCPLWQIDGATMKMEVLKDFVRTTKQGTTSFVQGDQVDWDCIGSYGSPLCNVVRATEAQIHAVFGDSEPMPTADWVKLSESVTELKLAYRDKSDAPATQTRVNPAVVS